MQTLHWKADCYQGNLKYTFFVFRMCCGPGSSFPVLIAFEWLIAASVDITFVYTIFFKVTVYLQIDNFLQILIFGLK